MYDRRRQGMGTLPSLVAITLIAVCNDAQAITTTFNYANGFASASEVIRNAYGSAFSGSVINLTGAPTPHQAGGSWYTTQQNIQSFTTDFTFQIAAPLSIVSVQGITFCIQNNANATTNPYNNGLNTSGDANLEGYGSYALTDGSQYPIHNSVAIKFDLSDNRAQNNYPTGGAPSSTGLFINGGPLGALDPELDLNPSGINLYSGHPVAVHLVYDGSILTMTVRDTATNAQYRTSWPVDIPSIAGSTSAWVGFTGGNLGLSADSVLSWSFSEGYAPRLAAPSFSVAGGSYSSGQSVSLSAPAGATIYYTTNGQQPTTSSNRYTGPISVASSEIVQAVAIQSGFTDSLVAVANYGITPAGTPLINFANGFGNASGLVTANGSALLKGSVLQLTDIVRINEAGSAWYAVPVNVQSFSTNFTMQLLSPGANGMTFTIQNQPPKTLDTSILYVSGGPNALANSGNGLGYAGDIGAGSSNAGLLTSAAVIFDMYNGSGNLTGLYTNGTTPIGSSIDMSSSQLSLHSGNPFNVALTYNGTTLGMVITDTKTKASFSKSWAINIPTVVGGTSAYVGFTGGTGGMNALQQVSAWTYATSAATVSQGPAVPAAPTNLHVQ